eukprot:1157803-Pelagomonas_calceolata.AAC.9
MPLNVRLTVPRICQACAVAGSDVGLVVRVGICHQRASLLQGGLGNSNVGLVRNVPFWAESRSLNDNNASSRVKRAVGLSC